MRGQQEGNGNRSYTYVSHYLRTQPSTKQLVIKLRFRSRCKIICFLSHTLHCHRGQQTCMGNTLPPCHLQLVLLGLGRLTETGRLGNRRAYLPWRLGPQGLAVILNLPLLTAFAVGAHHGLHLVSSVFALLLCLHRMASYILQRWCILMPASLMSKVLYIACVDGLPSLHNVMLQALLVLQRERGGQV